MISDDTLDSRFFRRPALTVAEELIGRDLVRRTEEGIRRVRITETEAYIGPEDLACHASKGRTPRTEVMFGPAGHWYVYLVYGMHWMLNVVTGEEGHPEAVLIRGAGEWVGPARLTRALDIDKRFYGLPAATGSGLWIAGASNPQQPRIRCTPRIGVEYAGEWALKPYRFVSEG